MDMTALVTALPNLAFAIVGFWYLMGQNKDLREQLNAATESRVGQIEKVITAMQATTVALNAVNEMQKSNADLGKQILAKFDSYRVVKS